MEMQIYAMLQADRMQMPSLEGKEEPWKPQLASLVQIETKKNKSCKAHFKDKTNQTAARQKLLHKNLKFRHRTRDSCITHTPTRRTHTTERPGQRGPDHARYPARQS